jgi:phosphate/phosphite/phosphonate ABC transporter binding protein
VQFGIVAYGGAQVSADDAKKLETVLSSRVGQSLAVRVFQDESALATALARGELDAAWMPPLAFVAARAHSEVKPLAKVMRHGFGDYRSVIFTRLDRGVGTLDDLKGGTMAWVDKRSATGYLFPLAMLQRAGLKPSELFANELFAGDHAAVCRAVLDGTAVAGATFADERPRGEPIQIDGCLQSLGPADAAKLVIVQVSKPIPNDVVAVRAGCPTELASGLKNTFLLLSIDAEGKQLLSSVFKADSFADASIEEFGFASEAAQ